jgi:hypothetical protein
MRERTKKWMSLLVCAVSTVGTGCVSKELDERLESSRAATASQTKELTRLNRADHGRALDWKTALKLLEERNLNLRQGRARLEQVRRERDEQWKTWIPRLGVNANLLSSLADLGSFTASNMSASVVAPLAIPNPMTEQARAFANALAYLETKDSLELSYRRQVTTLYRLFSRYESQLDREARAAGSVDPSASVMGALGTLETRAAGRDSTKSIQASLAQLLNLPGEHPVPVAASRPNLDFYEHRIHRLVPGENYGQLALRLSAYQIEGALLSEKGIELRRWPSVWISGSTPALYDTRNDETGTNFEAEQIFLFGGLTKSYDMTGSEAASIRTAKENTEFVRQNLRLRLDQETREWLRLRERYDQLLLKRKLVEERLRRMRSESGGSAFADLTTVRRERGSLDMIEESKEQLELEVWVWDDEKWK